MRIEKHENHYNTQRYYWIVFLCLARFKCAILFVLAVIYFWERLKNIEFFQQSNNGE